MSTGSRSQRRTVLRLILGSFLALAACDGSEVVAPVDSGPPEVDPPRADSAWIRGQVVERGTDRGIAGARIDMLSRTLFTDSAGRFSLDDVSTDSVHVEVRADGYATLTRSYAVGVGANELLLPLDPEVPDDPPEDDPDPVTGALRGTVVYQDATTAAPGARVLLAPADSTVWSHSLSLVTDSLGHFAFTEVPIGRWTLTLQGEFETLQRSLEVAEGERSDTLVVTGVLLDIRVAEGSVPMSAEVTVDGVRVPVDEDSGRGSVVGLPRGPAVLRVEKEGYEPFADTLDLVFGTNAREVSLIRTRVGFMGQVIAWPDGAPIADATVRVRDQEARTDAQGRYRIANLTPGTEALLHVDAANFEPRVDTATVSEGTEVLDVELFPMGTTLGEVSGTVRSARTGEPLQAAIIIGEQAATTDAQGRYRIPYVPLYRELPVEVTRAGYLFLGAESLVFSEARQTLDVELEPDDGVAPLSGRVTSELDGSPLPGVEIRVAGLIARSDAHGDYLFPELPVGDHFLRANFPGATEHEALIRHFEPGRRYDFQMQTGFASLSGVVRSRAGTPLAGALVRAAGKTVTTDSGGRYTITRLYPVSTTVSAQAPSYDSYSGSIDLDPGQNSLNITLREQEGEPFSRLGGG